MNIEDVFIRSQLGEIHIGQNKSVVTSLVGEPDGVFSNDDVYIFKYCDLQLTFDANVLTQIALDITEHAPQVPLHLGPLKSKFRKSTTPYEFLDSVEAVGVHWSIYRNLTFNRQLCIQLRSVVLAFFDLDRREMSTLQIVKEIP